MKVQTAVRIEKELLEQLKIKAKAEKRSLNNYIEFILSKVVGDIPNDITKKAIHEAERRDNLEEIQDLENYRQSLLNDV